MSTIGTFLLAVVTATAACIGAGILAHCAVNLFMLGWIFVG